MMTQAENIHHYLLTVKPLKSCEISIGDNNDIWIRSADYINVFEPLDRAGRLFGYRVDIRGRDFDRPSQSYYVRMVRVKS